MARVLHFSEYFDIGAALLGFSLGVSIVVNNLLFLPCTVAGYCYATVSHHIPLHLVEGKPLFDTD